ncbi:MAG: SRPBCC family protein [Gemmatimonadota bacterium]|nr:SRPBCC family protein [Gemmatimonadota bacterium]
MIAPTTNAADQNTDRITEAVRLPQPPARVWRALTDPAELGAWFGADLTSATIAPGARVRGSLTHKGYEHVMLDVIIEEMVPERRFSWRWHPHALDGSIDYAAEARTLVEFTLEGTADGGTLLRVVESGFDALSSPRRATAFLGNSKGWVGQLQKRIPAYLASAS